jgi:hypothetical protein
LQYVFEKCLYSSLTSVILLFPSPFTINFLVEVDQNVFQLPQYHIPAQTLSHLIWYLWYIPSSFVYYIFHFFNKLIITMCYSETCANTKCVLFQIASYCTTSRKQWSVLSLPQVRVTWKHCYPSRQHGNLSCFEDDINVPLASPPPGKLCYGMENTVSRKYYK